MADEEEAELSEKQKKEIAKWFLLNSPPGEIQFVAKGLAFDPKVALFLHISFAFSNFVSFLNFNF